MQTGPFCVTLMVVAVLTLQGLRMKSRSHLAIALALLACAAATAFTHRPEPTRSASVPPPDQPVLFNRDIRPILSNNCFKCHGPDGAAREADLRLDNRADATRTTDDGITPIVPGDLARSELIARITHNDPSERMPPLESHKSLTDDEIALLKRWVEQGAPWQDHWSFIAPQSPIMPAVADEAWLINPIDNYILARLESEDLKPSERADRETLVRRVTLDLTGLPPTLKEIDAFWSDADPLAYEHLVDRLLSSDRYGEHMARYWLDAARYGDTHGLHLDNARMMWPWRDWVINAFNANMPFDQFTIEQLAGDLLPEPTNDQIVATGFNRNHVTTSEGGAIDAEYLVKYAADRSETTATVWMGLTVACAQCHDHKFDPITQEDYYELFAFFNNITENAMDGNRRDPPPVVRSATPELQAPLTELDDRIAQREAVLDAPNPVTDAAQTQWQLDTASLWTDKWQTLDPVEFRATNGTELRKLEDGSLLAQGENPDRETYEITARTDATNLRLLRLEALTHEDLPFNGPGRAENANFVLSEIEAEITSIIDPSQSETLRFVSASADHEQMNGPFLVAHAIDGITDDTNGWAIEGFKRRENRTAVFATDKPFGYVGGSTITVRLKFDTHFKQHAIGRTRLSVTSDQTLYTTVASGAYGVWHSVGPFQAANQKAAYQDLFGPEHAPGAIDLDATFGDDNLAWAAKPEYLDGKIHNLTGSNCATYLTRTIHAPTGRSVGLSFGSDDSIKVWLNGELVLDHNIGRAVRPDQEKITIDLVEGENPLLMKISNFSGGYGFYFKPEEDEGGNEFLRNLDLITADSLDDDQATRLRRYYRKHLSPEMREINDELATLTLKKDTLEKALPTTLVMRERDERMQTFVLFRGEYDQKRGEVYPDVPGFLPPLPPEVDVPRNRLALAKWLVDPDHPLVARVTINRMWQQDFGTGIVKTAEDFGSQGQWPSHPELLDYLAAEFIDSGWDVKHMMRLLVTSATYRQVSSATPELIARDPENRLYARGPRFRMDAEQIRDVAMAASGLLVDKIGGPSVKPYQPAGLWKAVAYEDSNTRNFTAEMGEAAHRRSLYTYWKRTSPPPNMTAFDAPSRETCTVRRPRTNTPLQALVLLNDPQFVEIARALAERAADMAGPDEQSQIQTVFRLLTARLPNQAELDVLEDLYAKQVELYESDPAAAAALLGIDQTTDDAPTTEPTESDKHALAARAALTNLVATIMSLDESITKG